MTVTYDSYEAKAVQAVIEMLAASATFRTLVGAANAAAAKAKIIESWGGDPSLTGRGTPKMVASDNSVQTNAPPYAAVHLMDLPSSSIGVGVWEHTGSLKIELFQLRSAGSGETPPEAFRRARNVLGGIRADIEAVFGTTVNGVGALARGAVQVEAPALANQVGADGDCFYATLTIDFEG